MLNINPSTGKQAVLHSDPTIKETGPNYKQAAMSSAAAFNHIQISKGATDSYNMHP